MSYPETKMVCVSNLWLRQMHFQNSGDQNEGHVHNYDHVTLLAKGSVTVEVEGQATKFKAPHMIYIAKGKRHFLIADEDDTIAYCVHALRTGEREEDILDPAMIPAGVSNPLHSGLVQHL
jgi:quercetin dioxygenase-like cupin family protein